MQETKIGMTVNKLARKSGDKRVVKEAKRVVGKWKDVLGVTDQKGNGKDAAKKKGKYLGSFDQRALGPPHGWLKLIVLLHGAFRWRLCSADHLELPGHRSTSHLGLPCCRRLAIDDRTGRGGGRCATPQAVREPDAPERDG